MTVLQRKRVYDSVTTAPVSGGIVLLLDGRPARTPGGRALAVPTLALAGAVADEWRAQGKEIRPDSMPLTQLAATAIDRIEEQRDGVIDALVAYGLTDLLCYRAQHPADLVARQDASWNPLLDWAAEALGARLVVTHDVFPQPQPPETTAALRRAVAPLTTLELAALSSVVQIAASLIIGLALVKGRLDAAQTFTAAMLDERYQAERWGEDAWASERTEALRAELAAAETFLRLARQG